jgi:hypothetical protein
MVPASILGAKTCFDPSRGEPKAMTAEPQTDRDPV